MIDIIFYWPVLNFQQVMMDNGYIRFFKRPTRDKNYWMRDKIAAETANWGRVIEASIWTTEWFPFTCEIVNPLVFFALGCRQVTTYHLLTPPSLTTSSAEQKFSHFFFTSHRRKRETPLFLILLKIFTKYVQDISLNIYLTWPVLLW